jgi:hypothetical protein
MKSIDYIEIKESKELFEQQFTHIYHIFFDSFISLETAFKQRSNQLFNYLFLLFNSIFYTND